MPELRASSRALVLALIAWGPACQSRSFVALPPPPDEIAWVAAYLANEDGSIAASTTLLPNEPGLLLELSTELDAPDETLPIRVLGYSDADLSSVGGGPAPGITSARLVVATGCESPLPAASFDTWLHGVEAPSVPITASWLEGRCPSVLRDRALLVDASCAQPHCGQTVEVSGCSIRVDLPRCDRPSYSGIIQADGRVCFDQPAEVCESLPSRSLEMPLTNCTSPEGDCRLRFVPAAPANLEVEVLSTYPDLPPRVHDAESMLAASYLETFVGYVTDILALDDQLIVLGHGGEWFVPQALDPGVRSELRYHDLETLELVRTATVPGWALRLDENPLTDTLVLTTRLSDGYYLIELARDGRALRRVLLQPLEASSSLLLFVSASFPLAEAGVYATVFDQEQATIEDEVTLVNLLSWQLERKVGLNFAGRNGHPRAARQLAGNVLVYADLVVNALVFLDLALGVVGQPELLPAGVLPLNNYTLGILPLPERDMVVQAFSGPLSGVASYRRSVPDRRAAYFEARADVAELELLPENPNRALVAVETGVEGDRGASLSLLDLENLEFLPGRRQVGFGPANRIRADQTGRLWVLFPWSGEVVGVRVPAE